MKATVERVIHGFLPPDGMGVVIAWRVVLHPSSGPEALLERETRQGAIDAARKLGYVVQE